MMIDFDDCSNMMTDKIWAGTLPPDDNDGVIYLSDRKRENVIVRFGAFRSRSD